MRPTTLVTLVSAAMLVLAVLPWWPYAYYQALRVVVCGSCVFLAYDAFRTHRTPWAWALVALAVLFNPLAPIHLERGAWFFLDLGAAAFLGVHWVAVVRRDRRREPML